MKKKGTGYLETRALIHDLLKKIPDMQPTYEGPVLIRDMSVSNDLRQQNGGSNTYRRARCQCKIYRFDNGIEVLINTINGKNVGVIVANGHIDSLDDVYEGGYLLSDQYARKKLEKKMPSTYIELTDNNFDPASEFGMRYASIYTPEIRYDMGNFHYSMGDDDGNRQYNTYARKDGVSYQNTGYDYLVESESYADYYYGMQIEGVREDGHLQRINDDNFPGILSQIRKGWATAKHGSDLQQHYEEMYELYGKMEEAGKGKRTSQSIIEDITQEEIQTASAFVKSVNQAIIKHEEEKRRKAEEEQERKAAKERKAAEERERIANAERERLQAEERERQAAEEKSRLAEEERKRQEAEAEARRQQELAAKRELIARIKEQQDEFMDKNKPQKDGNEGH